jgi:hypothetical protein
MTRLILNNTAMTRAGEQSGKVAFVCVSLLLISLSAESP